MGYLLLRRAIRVGRLSWAFAPVPHHFLGHVDHIVRAINGESLPEQQAGNGDDLASAVAHEDSDDRGNPQVVIDADEKRGWPEIAV
jgi:hypothetical protein